MDYPHQPLVGRRAVITGASSGIGTQIVREVAAAGADLLLVGRNREQLMKLTNELTEAGTQTAQFVVADVTAADAPQVIVDAALSALGGIDLLVNAAGIFLPTPFEDTDDQLLDDQFAVNVRAPFRLTRAALKHLGTDSSVIFISSICGYVGFPNSSAYCATKGAIELLVKALTAELAPRGIRVNAVAPGNVRTNMNAHLFADADYERDMLDATPAGRIGEAPDIAPAVVFLASPAASYVHGASLLVDGGWVAK